VRILGVIPARYASSRFPGKALASIAGTSMIERVYQQAIQSKLISKTVVATDDKRIEDHVKSFGGEVVMTSVDHPSGTDRCFEALQKTAGDFDFVINVQGDEPFIDPVQIDELAEMLSDPSVQLATLMTAVKDPGVLFDPGEVKIVLNHRNEALYFSREVIPHLRGVDRNEWPNHFDYYCHVGLYAYRSDILGEITQLEPSSLENAESLEQLRWLENGYRIKCGITNIKTFPIDTPADIEKVLKQKNFI
jgi:3-deoxy-manno-octulosonate cytidylyltransferase (CMP-KDO synthetase)